MIDMNSLKSFIDRDKFDYIQLFQRSNISLQDQIPVTLEIDGYTIEKPTAAVYATCLKKPECLRAIISDEKLHSIPAPSYDLDVPVNDDVGLTIAHVAAIVGSIECLRIIALASFGTYLLNTPTKQGFTPLHFAVMKHNPAMAIELLKWGCLPFQRTKTVESPMFYALEMEDDLQVAAAMLNYLADYNPMALSDFLNEPTYRKTKGPLIYFAKKPQTLELLKNAQERISKTTVPSSVPCSMNGCNRRRKVRTCHVCHLPYCPIHADEHSHQGIDDLRMKQIDPPKKTK